MRFFTFSVLGALATLAFPAAALSQVSQDWLKTFPTQAAHFVYLATDGAGSLFVGGTSAPGSYSLIKYNSAGTEQWAVTGTIGSAKGGFGVAGIGTDHAGNVYLVANGVSGIFVTEFNTLGSQRWYTTLPYTSRYGVARVMTVDAAGNVYIGGQIYTSSSSPVFNYMTIKVTGGVQQWLSTFEGTANIFSYVTAIRADTSGNAYVTGVSIGAHVYRGVLFTRRDTTYDMTTIKYGTSGNALWTDTYNGGYGLNDFASDLALDPGSGNVYVVGQSINNTSAFAESDLIAYSSAGSQLWVENNTAQQNYSAVAVDPGGNILIGGIFLPAENGFSISKYAPTGSIIWTYTNTAFPIGGSPNQGNNNLIMALDKQGNCYITGPLNSDANYVTAEISSSGTLGWSATYSPGGTDGAAAIAIFTPLPTVAGQITYPEINVTGTAGNGANFTTIQYSYHPVNASYRPDTLNGRANTLADPFSARLSNFPNPFRNTSTITYALAYDSHVTLQVYDQSGNPVALLFDGNQGAGPHSVLFSAGRLATGVYHYRIIATSPQGGFTLTKQMIIQ
jgi:hypothetical protein